VLRLSRGQVMPSFPLTIRRLVREHDVVQVHSPMLETAIVGCLAHRAGRKMLLTHHGDLVMPAGLYNQIVQRTVGCMLDKGAEQADLISMYTQDYIDHSAFLRPHAHKVVPVLPPFSFPAPDVAAARAWRTELGLDDAQVIGFAGRWVEEKGFDYLLQAMPLVRERFPSAVFVYAGETRVVYERFYERCLPLIEAQRDHIVELGLITDSQRMANFYALCDVFTLPSRTDCLASVQVEAMLSGTSVVATNIPGARQVVRMTGMGRLVEPHNPQALAQGLIAVLSDRDAYVKPVEMIRTIFDVEASLEAYEALFRRLIDA
jgi:glycosyltransferase involved in cell wall biosynthesis